MAQRKQRGGGTDGGGHPTQPLGIAYNPNQILTLFKHTTHYTLKTSPILDTHPTKPYGRSPQLQDTP